MVHDSAPVAGCQVCILESGKARLKLSVGREIAFNPLRERLQLLRFLPELRFLKLQQLLIEHQESENARAHHQAADKAEEEHSGAALVLSSFLALLLDEVDIWHGLSLRLSCSSVKAHGEARSDGDIETLVRFRKPTKAEARILEHANRFGGNVELV